MWCKHDPYFNNSRKTPPPRAGHSWAFYKQNQTLYMFGGYGMEESADFFYRSSYDQTYYNDLWSLDFSNIII